jgi:hypothetical protein
MSGFLLNQRRTKVTKLIPNPTVVLVLVPLLLIISSNVLPAVNSTFQNKDISIIAKALAKLGNPDQNRNAYTVGADKFSPFLYNSLGYRSTTLIDTSPTLNDPFSNISSPYSSSTPSPSFVLPHTSKADVISSNIQKDETVTTAAITPGDQLHVIWDDDTSGNEDVHYKRDGADFDPTTVNLSETEDASTDPAIAVLSNNVHVVWREGIDIFYMRSTDRGGVFAPAINISNDPAAVSELPVIAVSGNNVHVVWVSNNDILYRRSIDGGVSFVEPIKNLSNNPNLSRNPAIAASGNTVHVVWHDITPGNLDIFYTRSVNGGSSFPDLKNLSDNGGESGLPAIASSGSSVHIVWQDSTSGDRDIFYRRSLDGGSTFPNVIKNLSDNVGFSGAPAIAVSVNNIHVVWTDDTFESFEILHRRSINGGNTFPNIILNLSNNIGTSFVPAVAVAGTNVYVAWQDDTKINIDILYRPSADGGVAFDPAVTNLSASAGDSTTQFGPGIAISE